MIFQFIRDSWIKCITGNNIDSNKKSFLSSKSSHNNDFWRILTEDGG